MVQPYLKTRWQIPYKVKLTSNSMSSLGIYLKEMKTYVHRETCTQIFIATLKKNNGQKSWQENG